ncbi:hypothetical protein R0153_27495 [Bacillus sp. W1]|nr:hypothetical protein [Bacillus sp. W1]
MSTDISNSTDSSEARGKDKTWQSKAHDTRQGQQQVMNERTMKEEQTRKEISERNENNEA